MKNRPLRSAVSALLGLVFAAGLAGEAYGVHDCPHHHGTASGEASHAAVTTGQAGAAEARARTSDPAPLQAPPEGPCTCVGNCHAASVALDAPAPPTLTAAVATERTVSRPASGGRVPRAAAYLLPFANGPPYPLA